MNINRRSNTFSSLILCAVIAAMSAPAHSAGEAGALALDADRLIEQCVVYAAQQKLPALSIGVIDASGAMIAFKRQRGASSVSAEVAVLKARTAMRLNLPTTVLSDAAADPQTRDVFMLLQLTTIAGGVPITDKSGNVLGALGVSGAAPDQDAACAQSGVEGAPGAH